MAVRWAPACIFFCGFAVAAQQAPTAEELRKLVAVSGKAGAEAVRECADRGEVQCILVLGEIVEEGRLFQRDLATARNLYEMAAYEGSEEAIERLVAVEKLIAGGVGGAPTKQELPAVPEQSRIAATGESPAMPILPPPPERARVPPPIGARERHPEMRQTTTPGEAGVNRSTAKTASIQPRVPAEAVAHGVRQHVQAAPGPQPRVETRYERGVQIITSSGNGSLAEVVHGGVEKRRHRIEISIFNASSGSLSIAPQLVAVEQGGEHLRVLPYEDAQKVAKRSQTWKKVGLVLAAAAEGYNAGSAGYESYSGTYRGSQGYGTFTISGYDSAARQRALSESNARLGAYGQAMQQDFESEIEALQAGYLRRHTLQPGQGYSGFLLVDRSKSRGVRTHPLVLTIRLGEDTHRLSLDPR